VLRQVELKGPIGVSKLRYKYGGRKTSRGMKPEHFYKGSGKVIRTILQQLEDAGYLELKDSGQHKGRVTTPEGSSFIFNTAEAL
jgi:small subunit ribosomal protein S19e